MAQQWNARNEVKIWISTYKTHKTIIQFAQALLETTLLLENKTCSFPKDIYCVCMCVCVCVWCSWVYVCLYLCVSCSWSQQQPEEGLKTSWTGHRTSCKLLWIKPKFPTREISDLNYWASSLVPKGHLVYVAWLAWNTHVEHTRPELTEILLPLPSGTKLHFIKNTYTVQNVSHVN